ncbi:hypothetical protein DM02DRAFT_723586, partial [Periconia macrospinosa]
MDYLTFLPHELKLEITRNLDQPALNALTRTSKSLIAPALEFLYIDITVNIHGLFPLLDRLLKNPDFAAKARSLRLDIRSLDQLHKWSYFRNEQEWEEFGESCRRFLMSRLPVRIRFEDWIRDLKNREIAAGVGLLLCIFPNLESLEMKNSIWRTRTLMKKLFPLRSSKLKKEDLLSNLGSVRHFR